MSTRITPLPYLASARVTGEDAGVFLHAQLSADIAGLQDGAASFACYCSPRGQVLGLLLVGRDGPSYRVVGSAELLPGLLERLGRYVLRARVLMQMEAGVVCAGEPGSSGAAGEGFALAPGGLDFQYRLLDVSAGATPAPAGAEAWKAGELGRGVAWLGPATTERFIPQMLGFEALGAVSYSKGCYPGQEIVARAHYLGQVKRRPAIVTLQGAAGLEPGTGAQLTAAAGEVEATVIDAAGFESASGSVCTRVMLVAGAFEAPLEFLRAEGRSYRCATM